MTIFAPDEVNSAKAAKTEVLVNVFAGSPRSVVEMRLGDTGAWTRMTPVARNDPYYERLKASEPPNAKRPLPKPAKSRHLWQAMLPANPSPGSYLIHVRTTDMYGQIYQDHRVIRINRF